MKDCASTAWSAMVPTRGTIMLNIKKSIGSVVAADTQASIGALDQAVAQQARMCASLVEASQEAGIAIAVGQPVLEALSASLSGLVESRAHLAKATRDLAVIQSRSTLRETAFGCPSGLAPRAQSHDVSFAKEELTGAEA
jgi:hypothetical protein